MERINGSNSWSRFAKAEESAIALTYIHGIGRSSARKSARSWDSRIQTVQDLSEDEVNRLREEIDKNCTVEGDLRRIEGLNVKRLIEINCYRGSVIVKDCRRAGSAPKQTLALVAAESALRLPARR